MIELGTIPIKNKASIVEARNKIRLLAEDLELGSITSIRIATMTSELSRRMLATGQPSVIKVAVDKGKELFELALEFTPGQACAAIGIKVLEAIFDNVKLSEKADGVQSIKTSKVLLDPQFEPAEEFIERERRLVGRLTREELHVQLQEAYEELQKTQEELVRSERLAAMGQFAGSFSHEIRNPLGAIAASVYYLETELGDADVKVKENLERIKSSVDSSTAVIESLLNLTRMEEPQLEGHGLTAIISDAIDTAKIPTTVDVIRDFPEQEVPVNADREQLRMAFKNIVKNADEAMDGKGTLTITIRTTAENQAEISFADTGSGIAPENLKKVFKPLFSTKATGIGFGLSICKMIIDSHGGTIEARSEPGEGAVFIAKLPLYTAEDKEA